MNGFRTFGYDRPDIIQRVIALLWSFAALAERAAGARTPVRLAMLWIVRRAEAPARRFTARAALDAGLYLDEDLLVPLADGSDIDAAISLADQFVVLAQALETILYCLTGLAPQHGQFAGSRGLTHAQIPINWISLLVPSLTHGIVRPGSFARAPPIRGSLASNP